jgi:hypothetical protein
LLVISFDDMALRRTLEPLIAKKMLNIYRDHQLDGITYLGHRNTPVSLIPSTFGRETPFLSKSLMKVVTDIGHLKVYRMNVEVVPLLRQKVNEKFYDHWKKAKNPKVTLFKNPEHKFLGQPSLQINKIVKKDLLIAAPLTYRIPSQGNSFIFYASANKRNQKSVVTLSNVHLQETFPINLLFGAYREDKGNLVWERTHPHILFRHSKPRESFIWEISFTLTRLKQGVNEVSERFSLFDQVSYFSGIHGYLLHPVAEN